MRWNRVLRTSVLLLHRASFARRFRKIAELAYNSILPQLPILAFREISGTAPPRNQQSNQIVYNLDSHQSWHIGVRLVISLESCFGTELLCHA